MERRFFNQSQPQTLQGAVFLLYANVVVALLFRSGGEGIYGVAAYSLTRGVISGGTATLLGNLVAIAVVVGSAGAGYLIANEKKVGWRLGVVVAAAPLVAFTILVLIGYPQRLSILDVISISFAFDVILLVLLLHPQTRSYEKIWFK